MSINHELFTTLNYQQQVHPSHDPATSIRDIRIIGYRWDFDFRARPNDFVFVNEDLGETFFSQDACTEFKKVKLEDGELPFSKGLRLELERLVQSGASTSVLVRFCQHLGGRFRIYSHSLQDITQEWFAFPTLDDTETANVLAAVIEHDTNVLIKAVNDVKDMALYLSGDGDTDEKVILRQYIDYMNGIYDKYIKRYHDTLKCAGGKYYLAAMHEEWVHKSNIPSNYVPQEFIF